MTRADRKNSVLRKTRLKFQQPLAAAGRPSARNYEALSKTSYQSTTLNYDELWSKEQLFLAVWVCVPWISELRFFLLNCILLLLRIV